MMYTCAAEFDFIETQVGNVIYFLAVSHQFPFKALFLLVLMCLQTLIRYIKTMLLPINVLIVGFIAGRVSCFHLDNGWFTPPMCWYACPAFIYLQQYSRFTVFCQFGVYQLVWCLESLAFSHKRFCRSNLHTKVPSMCFLLFLPEFRLYRTLSCFSEIRRQKSQRMMKWRSKYSIYLHHFTGIVFNSEQRVCEKCYVKKKVYI